MKSSIYPWLSVNCVATGRTAEGMMIMCRVGNQDTAFSYRAEKSGPHTWRIFSPPHSRVPRSEIHAKHYKQVLRFLEEDILRDLERDLDRKYGISSED